MLNFKNIKNKDMRMISFRSILIALVISVAGFNKSYSQTQEKPNILWIVSEDNSPLIGAYGDDFATTPNIDKLAEEGFLYTHAYANAPVCAPARNTIITGVYANSSGNSNMRSNYPKSEEIKLFPSFLRKAGYYVTNNAKEDYNITQEQTRDVWNESSGQAHYKNREPGQPFFAVFNTGLSHESSIHKIKAAKDLRHDPGKVKLPPYHPDTPEIRHDWAQYYDNIEDMDNWVGAKLKELEESGEAENTIVIYYGDHGGVLGRSKRYVYETGTRVPFIVRIPDKFKHLWPNESPGSKVERIISFVDLAPTMLSIIETSVPDFMQGEAFLGSQKEIDEPEYAFMFRDRMDERYDMSRAVRDKKFRYIRNYLPYRIYGQRLDFLWRARSIRSWEETCLKGDCNDIQQVFWNTKPTEELYDTENDPWEVNNLALDPEYSSELLRMRKANLEWMINIKDSGFIPEAELVDMAGKQSIYDYMRTGKVPLEDIIKIAEKIVMVCEKDIMEVASYLKSDNSAIRYWGATGALILGAKAIPLIPELKKMVDDPSPNVRIVASEALYTLGEKNAGRIGFRSALKSSNSFARTHALNAIESVGDNSDEMQEAVIAMAREAGKLVRDSYDHRAAKTLLDKWKIDPNKYGIKYAW